ncbi:MAG TPA: transposase [Ktedonobacteraceae bacterium]|nr:transposase [Ktedonobacteraceae bacterium]
MGKREAKEAGEERSEPSAVMERLNWQVAWRADERVAQALYTGEEIEVMHELSEAGLLDEFFAFVEEIGMMAVLEQMELSGVQRVLVPTVQFVLLYLLKVLFGGQSMNELPGWLFSNLALMELVGFNAQQVEEGLTRRGDAQRKTKQKQGPLTPQCLADNISKLTVTQMETCFNQMVQCVVGWGLLDGERIAALDGSKLPTPETYEGCGKVKQTRRVKVKGQKEPATEEYYVYGWKVLVLIDVQTRLPLSMKVVKIQEYEGRWLVPLLGLAQANLGPRGHISKIVIDRGYLDGEDLWQVHLQGILFVVVGKANMVVTQDAQALAKRERAQVRERVVRHGHGTTASEERLRTELVGIEGLTTYDTYGDAQQTQYAHRRDYEGQPINAVVVRRWNNRTPATEGTVYLTNGPVTDPFVVFDDYDWRSVIENGIFKEGKHPWHLGQFPKRTEAAVVVHCYFTLLVMALCTAFRLWQAKPATTPTAQTQTSPTLSTTLLGGEGTARWRLRLKQENRDKVIVFFGDAYGIFHLAELAILTGMRLRRLPPYLCSPQAVLQRYGISP